MNAIEQMKEGLHRIWDNLNEGWLQLRDTATNAITRFRPIKHTDDIETSADRAVLRGSRWGLLAADVEEDEKSVRVRLEIPGIEASDFDITVVDNQLVVRGTKHTQRERSEGAYHITECAYGSFERIIPLPCIVDDSKTQAKYKHGVLSVELPKNSASQRRRIEVKNT